jgi:hypothetical protein
MLSNQTLERVGVAYRRGYRDGYDKKAAFIAVKPEYIKPFAEHDYTEGHKAGSNDRAWDDYFSGEGPSPRDGTWKK